MEQKEITIFVGHFGSGKTETALNYVLDKHKDDDKTVLIDLDIVNPFFRSSDLKSILNEKGIELISPNFVATTSDVPSLPGSIQGAFVRDLTRIVFDVGGDGVGAKVLSTYNPYFEQNAYRMYLVINTKRPMTDRAEGILEYLQVIEQKSRLKISHLICNANLADETDLQIVEEGYKIVQEVSIRTGLPIAWVNINNLLEPMEIEVPQALLNTIKPYMRTWRNT